MNKTNTRFEKSKKIYQKLLFWVGLIILVFLIVLPHYNEMEQFADEDQTHLQEIPSLDNPLVEELSLNIDGSPRKVLAEHFNLEATSFKDTELVKIPNQILSQTQKIFEDVVDFSSNFIGGRELYVLYEAASDSSKKILAAELVDNGRSYKAILHTSISGSDIYLTPNGKYIDPEFLKSPLKSFRRITSNFSYSRNHPILDEIRSHKGMDFAAKAGTEVRAVADGKVILKGYVGGFGNLISLAHEGNNETRYGHLLKFAPNIKTGDQIRRGQLIGYVGMTGLATAPHLHFELLENGRHIDPRKTLSGFYNFDDFEKKKFSNDSLRYIELLNKFKSSSSI